MGLWVSGTDGGWEFTLVQIDGELLGLEGVVFQDSLGGDFPLVSGVEHGHRACGEGDYHAELVQVGCGVTDMVECLWIMAFPVKCSAQTGTELSNSPDLYCQHPIAYCYCPVVGNRPDRCRLTAMQERPH